MTTAAPATITAPTAGRLRSWLSGRHALGSEAAAVLALHGLYELDARCSGLRDRSRTARVTLAAAGDDADDRADRVGGGRYSPTPEAVTAAGLPLRVEAVA